MFSDPAACVRAATQAPRLPVSRIITDFIKLLRDQQRSVDPQKKIRRSRFIRRSDPIDLIMFAQNRLIFDPDISNDIPF